jgi:hypothetical protein
MPKKTPQQWRNWVKISNKMGNSMLKAFPNASPRLRAKWKPIKMSDYRWDKKAQTYVLKSKWKQWVKSGRKD